MAILSRIAMAMLAFTLSAAAVAEENAAVLKRIRSLAAMLSDGRSTLLPEATQIKKFALTEGNEKVEAYAVLFTVEGQHGGNGARQYLAVFELNPKENWPAEWEYNALPLAGIIKVGEDFERRFDSMSITGELITLQGKRWNNDAHCCPSAPASARYRFSNRVLSEIAPPLGTKTP